MNAHAYNAVGVPVHQLLNARRRLGIDRIEKAGAFEIAGGGLLSKTVFQVTVVVLVGLGMNQNGVVEVGLAHEPDVILQ